MSKEIIAARKAEDKKAADLLPTRQKFAASNNLPSAKEARAMTEASGGHTVDYMVNAGWTALMAIVKQQATDGKSFAQVPAGPTTTHPEVKAAIIKKLDAAGFKHELSSGYAYIYW